MRLTFVSSYYPPYSVGGAEESTFALARVLAERGHDVCIISLDLGSESPETEVPVHLVRAGVRLQERGRALRPAVFDRAGLQIAVARAVRRFAATSDLVHCQSLELLPGAYVGARYARLPIVATVRDFAGVCSVAVCLLDQERVPADCGVIKLQNECVPQFRRVYELPATLRLSVATGVRFVTARARSRLLRRCDAVYSISPDLGRIYADAGLVGGFEVLPNIASLEAVQRMSDGGYAIYAGRVSPGKGVAQLMKAARLVQEKLPDFRLLVAGYGSPEWCRRLEGHPAIEHVGRVDRRRLATLYAQARLAVVPSIWPEPLGRSSLEASLAGIPVVATNVGGLKETIVHGETGLLVPPRNAEALADAIVLLWEDADLRDRLGEAAKRFVSERFSEDSVCDRAEELYARVVASRSGTATTRKAVDSAGRR